MIASRASSEDVKTELTSIAPTVPLEDAVDWLCSKEIDGVIIVGDLDIFGCRIIVRPSESDEETEIIECERFCFMESLSFGGNFGRNGLELQRSMMLSWGSDFG